MKQNIGKIVGVSSGKFKGVVGIIDSVRYDGHDRFKIKIRDLHVLNHDTGEFDPVRPANSEKVCLFEISDLQIDVFSWYDADDYIVEWFFDECKADHSVWKYMERESPEIFDFASCMLRSLKTNKKTFDKDYIYRGESCSKEDLIQIMKRDRLIKLEGVYKKQSIELLDLL